MTFLQTVEGQIKKQECHGKVLTPTDLMVGRVIPTEHPKPYDLFIAKPGQMGDLNSLFLHT